MGGVLEDFKNKRLQKFYRAVRFPDLTNAPILRWELLKNEAYSAFMIQTGRGCPYDCEFCSVQEFNGRQFRHRKIDDIIKEIEYLTKTGRKPAVFFADDNLLAVPQYAQELLERLIPLKLNWWCQASVNRLKNDAMLDLMYRAGCRYIFVGLESVSQQGLDSIHKAKVNKAEEYREIIDKVNAQGINVVGSFMLGGDTDDQNVFAATAKFVDETNMPFAMLNILVPLPGTKLYASMEEEKRILSHEWWQYDTANALIRPKLISSEELQEQWRALLREVYSYKNLYKRLNNSWSKGILARRGSKRKLFTQERILFTLRALLSGKPEMTFFVLKSLWNSHVPSIMGVLLAVNWHDYAYRK